MDLEQIGKGDFLGRVREKHGQVAKQARWEADLFRAEFQAAGRTERILRCRDHRKKPVIKQA